ncbi:hypothetical protein WJX73_000032 [Symbiochloris irregularis]|uniref:BUB1 N-terminal domain-containing protein n=1 Tax=Symbiochloris irregularis TaxID=706552 RepID=A0AAW1NNU5_9CHLO
MALDWENSKENYQPLKQGRAPDQLKSTCLGKTDVESQRRQLWKAVTEYQGEDPLEPWLRLIKWTQTTFKSGGHQAQLRPILERCTRELCPIERYKTDSRYLRVWIHYADCLPEPQDVFSFLQTHGIGQDLALFYVAYAAFLELRRSFSKAETVLKDGIKRLAHPVDKLREKHDAFQARMARRKQRVAEGLSQEVPVEAAPGFLDENGQRSALACIQGPRVTGPLRRGPQPRVPSKGQESSSNGGLDIFVDEEFGGAGQPAAVDSEPQSSRGVGPTSWTTLATFEQTRKENVQAPSKWAGVTMKPGKGAVAPPVPPKLDIPMDEELRAANRAARKAEAVPQGTLRNRLDGTDLDEHLQADPLRLHRNKQLAAAAKAASGARPPRPPVPAGKDDVTAQANNTAVTGVPDSAKQGLQHSMGGYDAGLLQGPDGEEMSFEEVRAAAWQRNGDVTVATRDAYNAINSMFHGVLDSQAPWNAQELTAEHTGALAAACHRAACDPTITLSTKAAFEALGGAFFKRLPHEETSTIHLNKAASTALSQPAAPNTAPRNPPLGPANGSGQEATGPFAIYEDTQFLANKEGQTTGFAVPEDTTLFGERSSTAALPAPVRKPTSQDGGFLCYEDTEFLGDGPRAGLDGSVLQVLGSSPGSEFGGLHGWGKGGEVDDDCDFGVYEDTELL